MPMGLNTTKPKRQNNDYYHLQNKGIESLSSIERVTSSESEPSVGEETMYIATAKKLPRENRRLKPNMKRKRSKNSDSTPEPSAL